uniref:RsmB/NOP family class I SAM-dependent RNA methyltransferase n=1 Tax=Ignisphaera aggregans TaxID=334771 RepID=A0A7C2Z9W1_9CREN
MKSASLNVDNIVSVLANVIYLIENFHFNIDKAFTHTCRKYRCHSQNITREDLFNIAHEFVSKYILIKSMTEKMGKRNLSYRLHAKLFLFFKLREMGMPIPSKLRKAISRDFGIEDIDYVYMDLDTWQKLSYPKWLYEKLVEIAGSEEAENILNAMNKRIVWIRINTLKIDVDKALNSLEREGVRFEVLKNIPFLVKITSSPRPPRNLSLVKEGSAVIQDKASVLTVLAMDPKPGDIIYDFASAPGIKTSLIMQLAENKAHVIALDRSPRRLNSMRSLLKKYGVDIDRVQMILTDGRTIRLSKRADVSLVDAPCSSSGAIPKDPSIKILLKNPNIPRKMHQIQVALLENALKHSERLVYATCSILPEEGEEVVEKVIANNNAELENPPIPASRGYKKYKIWSKVYRTYPHIDDCQGFFIARIRSFAV